VPKQQFCCLQCQFAAVHVDVDLYSNQTFPLCPPQAARVPYYGKMAGAVGNYNAHMVAYPNIDWQKVAEVGGASRHGSRTKLHPPSQPSWEMHLVCCKPFATRIRAFQCW
jgi:hypothetical protein